MKTKLRYLFIALAGPLGIHQAAAQDTVCPAGTTLPGVDVASYDGSINWANVKAAGIVFAYAEATDGNAYTDPDFSINWLGMKSAGIVRGACAVFEPDVNGAQQAQYFVNVMGTLQPGDLPPMLEVDVTSNEPPAVIATGLAECVNEIKVLTGRVPIIYTYSSFFSAYAAGSTNFSAYPLWISHVGGTCPTLPEGWENWVIWQYSFTGTVPGISSGVDLDEFNGSMSDLMVFANPPSLNIARNSTDEISATWSTFAVGYVLQQNSTLAATNWVSVTNTPTVVSNQEQIILETSNNQMYLRLSHP